MPDHSASRDMSNDICSIDQSDNSINKVIFSTENENDIELSLNASLLTLPTEVPTLCLPIYFRSLLNTETHSKTLYGLFTNCFHNYRYEDSSGFSLLYCLMMEKY